MDKLGVPVVRTRMFGRSYWAFSDFSLLNSH